MLIKIDKYVKENKKFNVDALIAEYENNRAQNLV